MIRYSRDKDLFSPRKLKVKAWDTRLKLFLRLSNIECRKGELFRKDHVLLQFTGLYDKVGEEVYDLDIMLIRSERYIVFWDVKQSSWLYSPLENREDSKPFIALEAGIMRRLGNYFELNKD